METTSNNLLEVFLDFLRLYPESFLNSPSKVSIFLHLHEICYDEYTNF